jgi:hypothetical protein
MTRRILKADAEKIARDWVKLPGYAFSCVQKSAGEWWVYYRDADGMRRAKPLSRCT